jgi:hypothetical protein
LRGHANSLHFAKKAGIRVCAFLFFIFYFYFEISYYGKKIKKIKFSNNDTKTAEMQNKKSQKNS